MVGLDLTDRQGRTPVLLGPQSDLCHLDLMLRAEASGPMAGWPPSVTCQVLAYEDPLPWIWARRWLTLLVVVLEDGLDAPWVFQTESMSLPRRQAARPDRT